MKKLLVSAFVLSLAVCAPAFADETYTGHYVNLLNNKINQAAAPLVNKENELNQKQLQAKQKQQAQLDAQQQAINNKKQQIQNQKDLFNQEKNNIKSLFSVQ